MSAALITEVLFSGILPVLVCLMIADLCWKNKLFPELMELGCKSPATLVTAAVAVTYLMGSVIHPLCRIFPTDSSWTFLILISPLLLELMRIEVAKFKAILRGALSTLVLMLLYWMSSVVRPACNSIVDLIRGGPAFELGDWPLYQTYVLQHGSCALIQSLMYSSSVLFITKAIFMQLPWTGVVFSRWLRSKNAATIRQARNIRLISAIGMIALLCLYTRFSRQHMERVQRVYELLAQEHCWRAMGEAADQYSAGVDASGLPSGQTR